MSKYDLLISVMGSAPRYNDKTKYGRVLKWYNDGAVYPAPLATRKRMAAELLLKLIRAEVYYVQKVEVRNALSYASRGDEFNVMDDEDKICVYIDEI